MSPLPKNSGNSVQGRSLQINTDVTFFEDLDAGHKVVVSVRNSGVKAIWDQDFLCLRPRTDCALWLASVSFS